MAFHKHVLGVLRELELNKDKRLKTMITLIKGEDDKDIQNLEKMWKSIHDIEEGNHGALDNKWAYIFLDDIISCAEEKPYFLLKKSQRSELIRDIQKHTKALKKIYQSAGLDDRLISNEGQFFHGFSAQGENENILLEEGKRQKVHISDVLEFFEDYANEEISEAPNAGKMAKRQKSNRFIRRLGRRNKSRYGTGKPLQSVLITACSALYREDYSKSDISTLLNGRKK